MIYGRKISVDDIGAIALNGVVISEKCSKSGLRELNGFWEDFVCEDARVCGRSKRG